ncbi:MAG: mechanosensitive ion channel domain-containing protein [Thermonemataceae bacterium]
MRPLLILILLLTGIGQGWAQEITADSTTVPLVVDSLVADTPTIVPTEQEQVKQLEERLTQQQSQQDTITNQLMSTQKTLSQKQQQIDSLEQVAKTRMSVLQEQITRLDTLFRTQEEVPTTEEISTYLSGNRVLLALFLIAVAYVLTRLVRTVFSILAQRKPQNRTLYKNLIPITKTSIWLLTSSILIAGIFHLPLEAILILLAIIGIIVIFSAQDTFRNLFGGIQILIDTPFQLGDSIQISEHYGKVVKIGLLSTRLVTSSDTHINIPNRMIITHLLTNTNMGTTHRQMAAEIYLSPSTNIHRVKQIALEAAQTSQYVYINKPITIWLSNELKKDTPY